MEAEIDSTDRLVPAMTELFGEALLRRRFSHFETISPPRSRSVTLANSSTSVANSGGVPGAVLPSPILTENGISNLKASGLKKQPRLKAPARRQNNNNMVMMPSRVRFDMSTMARTSSMMSHATFILENDKRKPLLVSTGFQEGKNFF